MFKQALLGTTCLLAGLLIGIAGSNFAQYRVEAGVGTSKAAKPADGTWYQDSLEHHLQLKDRSWSIGISGETWLKDLRWAGRYVNFGQFSTRAKANADDNDNAALRGTVSSNPNRPACANSFSADCQYNWNGQGSMYGFLATLGAEPFTVGPIHVGLEAGAFLYKATWRERISPIDCPNNQCWEMQIDKRTGWQVGPEFGLTARWDYLYIAARRFGGPDKITAGFSGPVRQFEVGLSVPL